MACASSPDDRDARAVGLERVENLGLQPVRVLVVVHEHVIEVRAHVLREPRLRHHRVPVEQQVVVVENAAALLALHVGAEELREVLLPLRAPRDTAARASPSATCCVFTRYE